MSPEDRFADLIEVLEKKCTNLYTVCTARREPAEAVQSIESYHGVWKTFEILTLKDAPKEQEVEMITRLAEHQGVEITNALAGRMADINRGCSYENTVSSTSPPCELCVRGNADNTCSTQDVEYHSCGFYLSCRSFPCTRYRQGK